NRDCGHDRLLPQPLHPSWPDLFRASTKVVVKLGKAWMAEPPPDLIRGPVMTEKLSLVSRRRHADRTAGHRQRRPDARDIERRHTARPKTEPRLRARFVAFDRPPQPMPPPRQTAAGMQFERRLASVERRRHVVPRQLQQRRTLPRGVPAAAETLL